MDVIKFKLAIQRQEKGDEKPECFMLDVSRLSFSFFLPQPFIQVAGMGWVMVIRLQRKFYSGAAKKLPVKGLKNLLVIASIR